MSAELSADFEALRHIAPETLEALSEHGSNVRRARDKGAAL
jgi:hypothetical protein